MKTPRIAGKSQALIVILVIVVLAILLLVFLPKGTAEAPATSNATSTPDTAVKVTATPKSSEQTRYTIDTEKPIVSGLASLDIQNKINVVLSEKIETMTSEFQEQAVNIPVAGGPDTKSMLVQKLNSWTLTKDVVLVVRLEIMNYFSGAAHPISVSDVSNFDLATGKDLYLIDIFDTGTKYLDKISEYSIKELRKQLAAAQNLPEDSKDLVFFEEGASSNPENFSTFLIEDEGIRFVFGQYQVAPYVAGEQEVLIPYGELKDFMRKGPLADALTK